MNRASPPTGWVRNPVMKSPKLDPIQASSYELGWTHNPLTGCLNGCPYCYARKLANGRLRARYLANDSLAPVNEQYLIGFNTEYKPENDPFYPRFWPERMWLHELVGSKRKAKGIFVCDMSDLFGIGVPEEWIRRVLDVIKKHSQHRFYLLTKQPQNLTRFSPFPENCWVGVTATNEHDVLNATNCLFDHKIAKTQFLSIEPLLAWDTSKFVYPFKDSISRKDLDWLIIGAQTKPYKPPKIEWVREIVEAADQAKIPVFLKDNLKPLFSQKLSKEMTQLDWGVNFTKGNFLDIGNNTLWDADSLRQEMPK